MVYLRSVSKTPSYWAGNIKGGSHELPLLSVVTGFQFDQLAEHAHSLAEYGWIEFDGEQTVNVSCTLAIIAHYLGSVVDGTVKPNVA